MHLDVLDLRSFYYRTGLGRAAQRAMQEQIDVLWPDTKGLNMAGFGFAAPLMRPHLEKARRVIALMPGQQGVMRWPRNGPNVATLVEETLWPIEAGSIDRLIVLHGLETSETPSALLDECWRCLAPNGRALFIVPNRAGLWSRRDVTPFGFGRPYTLGQLETQVKKHRFGPERHLAALFQPPSNRPFWRKTGPMWEKMGRKLSSSLAGGIILLEVSKQEVAQRPRGLGAAVRRPLDVLDGIAQPEPKPV